MNYNTLDISSKIDDVYTKETLNNLSKYIDDSNAIPSQTILAGGTFQTSNAVTPSVTFPFAAQITRTATASATPSLAVANQVAGVGAGVSGTNTAQQNYTVAPLSDANTLRNQRALYQYAVWGTPLIGNYQPPRIFFQNKFFIDPYQLQLPHCVFCAKKQGEFTSTAPALYVNPALRSRWLLWDVELGEVSNLVHLGHFGRHELFMSRADYDSGALTNFVLFTLPNTIPTEVFAAFTPAPGGPGVPVPPVGPPATNSRVNPPERQNFNLIIPQGILPPP